MTLNFLQTLVEIVGISDNNTFLGDIVLNNDTFIRWEKNVGEFGVMKVDLSGQAHAENGRIKFGWAESKRIYMTSESQKKKANSLWIKWRT